MAERFAEMESVASLQGMLGYLNFASGRPDARFQKQINDAEGFLSEHGVREPWTVLHELLNDKLAELHAAGSSAFRDTQQAGGVLGLVFNKVVPAYRSCHQDLLHHLSDSDFYQPFFLARVFEAVLAQGSPWDEETRIVSGSLASLNDFVGHRPIAILETRPKGEPYAHERVRPIPLSLKGVGVAHGKYHDLVVKSLELLAATDSGILAEACLDPDMLDELALDPRAYDHGHPYNRRPNYVFGEWDPHHMDGQGRFRRYVVRQVTLDALLDRIANRNGGDEHEYLVEAAAVLVGTMLMAAGTSGSGPSTHDSTVTLATMMPRIAGYRDRFYTTLLGEMKGAHAVRLEEEAKSTRQPFGGARQHLNQFLARHRAAQLQQRHLAVLFAEMGYPEAGQKEAKKIPTASVRLMSEIYGRLSSGHLLAERGKLKPAVKLLGEIEELLHRGIDCGAFPDPWNILGFQGLFPLFTAREDSIRDTRIDELVLIVEQIFHLYSRLIGETAASGQAGLKETLLAGLGQFVEWWDKFASVEVSDVRRVHGGEILASANHVAGALARWHEKGKTAADLAFWREHLDGFQSPESFALVVEALLGKNDYKAALALLMNWLGQADIVPLDDGPHSFHALALRWMMGWTAEAGSPSAPPKLADKDRAPMVKRFFDYLEANAEDLWEVPTLDFATEDGDEDEEDEEERDELYSAAYDEVTYHDSADDNHEGSVVDEGEPVEDFDLELESKRLAPHLHFLSTRARLWQMAARRYPSEVSGETPAALERDEALSAWCAVARRHQDRLLKLLDHVHGHPLPNPLGSYESIIEFDRRRQIKEHFTYMVIGTCLENSMAVSTLEGACDDLTPAETGATELPESARPDWEPLSIRLEQAISRGNSLETRNALREFLRKFQSEPLLFTALADGGLPRQILRVRQAQSVLRSLVTSLPRLGLLRETFRLLVTARSMERDHPPRRQGVTEFNHLFQAGFQAVIEAVVESAGENGSLPGRDAELIHFLETLTRPFVKLWVEHSQSLQLSTLESLKGEDDWKLVRDFILRYGRDLFHAKFMTLANLRGILHRGVGSYFEYLGENPDPLHPVRLIDDLDTKIPRAEAELKLRFILQVLVENYEEYKDYNTTTPQSDYGENVHTLIDFLRLKSAYERHAWRLRPLLMTHAVLARKNRNELAVGWQEAFQRLTHELADQYMGKLSQLERTHGMRLRTVADRLQERFVRAMTLDRLSALIEPAMSDPNRPQPGPRFLALEKELQPFTTNPTGVGLDVPQWLLQLEGEVRRVHAVQANVAEITGGHLHVPQRKLSWDELQKQLEEWEEPGEE